jgi:hypothetical protein
MSSDMTAILASSSGSAVDFTLPLKPPSGQTLYTGNYIVAKVNGYRMLLTSAQLHEYVRNGDDLIVVNGACNEGQGT